MPIALVPANPFYYCAFGLTIRSDIPLPELRAVPVTEKPHVTIQLGAISPTSEPLVQMGPHVRMSESLFLLDVPCARFAVSAGTMIVIELQENATEADARAFLLGSVMGALCHQRGLLPLHASAVEAAGCAFAFVGAAGAGKSTLALQFHEKGYPLLCDDVCVISASPGADAIAWPGLIHFKLWRGSLEAAGKTISGLDRVLETMDKFRLPAQLLARDQACPLKAVYVLVRQEDHPLAIRRLLGVEAMRALVSHTYKGQFIPPMCRSAHFTACVEVLRSVAVFEVRKKWGLDFLAGDARHLEEHFMEFVRFQNR